MVSRKKKQKKNHKKNFFQKKDKENSSFFNFFLSTDETFEISFDNRDILILTFLSCKKLDYHHQRKKNLLIFERINLLHEKYKHPYSTQFHIQ